MKHARELMRAVGFVADANVQPQHPADAAAWIWHPRAMLGETAVLRFKLPLSLMAPARFRVHVSADQRFQLRVDGNEIGYGPDRGETSQWPVASYDLDLSLGDHRLEAIVWWIKDESLPGLRADPSLAGVTPCVRPPVAQATWRGGFLLAAEGDFAAQLNTGHAPWLVEDVTPAVKLVQPAFYAYHDIGPEFHVVAAKWNGVVDAVPAQVILGPIQGNPHGVQRPGWRLAPTNLPEQHRAVIHRGRIRALASILTDGPFAVSFVSGEEASQWTQLFDGKSDLTIPPHTQRTVLWDFEDYICGYAQLSTDGGTGARVRIDWAESLHESPEIGAITKLTKKGDRAEIAEKTMFGFGDEFLADGRATNFPAFWWRSGRYLRVQISTQDEPLVVTALEIISTGYPLGESARFESSDLEINQIVALCEKTTRVCAHEVWADCPYYEQMAYVGDSRLAALGNYACFADDRLSRRMISLFDDSRQINGLVAERAPASWQQVSVTYSLLWVLMVRDFAWWRDDADFVRQQLRGVRAMLAEVVALTGGDGLLHAVPGWPFVDWVPEWNEGCGPGMRDGDSSIVNLHLLLALRAHAELENTFGEPELMALATRQAASLEAAILRRFWSAERGLLADTSRKEEFSEHAQALGLLAGMTVPEGADRWVDAWMASDDLSRATIYFSFYIMDALHRAGRDAELHARMQLWREVLPTGLFTLPEAPEPTRSDCHGWSAHLRWHLAASVAGVRPSEPGFARVKIAPSLGELSAIEVDVRHPRGLVRVSFRRNGEHLSGTVTLPPGVDGELWWENKSRGLQAGENQINEF